MGLSLGIVTNLCLSLEMPCGTDTGLVSFARLGEATPLGKGGGDVGGQWVPEKTTAELVPMCPSLGFYLGILLKT